MRMDPLNTPALMMSAVLVVHLIGAAVIATSAAIVFTTVAIVVSIVKGCRQDLMPRRKVGENSENALDPILLRRPDTDAMDDGRPAGHDPPIPLTLAEAVERIPGTRHARPGKQKKGAANVG